MTNITKEQIKKAFVSDIENIDEYAYNNQDWYQQDAQRIRYILATLELSPVDAYYKDGKEVQLELGQEDNRYYKCIEFGDDGEYQINDEHKLSLLMRMSEKELRDYVETNEYDWIGDDYDHINEYLFTIMNHWQDEVEFDTEDYDNIDCMTVVKRAREWVRDGDFKSENKFEVAYQILMDYYNELPEDSRVELDKRLEKIGA
tara:strand:- start:154 stop:759 length:606 start_codon:yes stop_codon:yes gene_type:complete